MKTDDWANMLYTGCIAPLTLHIIRVLYDMNLEKNKLAVSDKNQFMKRGDSLFLFSPKRELSLLGIS